MTEFYYKNTDTPELVCNTEDVFYLNSPKNKLMLIVRLLDVLRSRRILTGWDVADVLGEGWEPCSSDMPPPWVEP